MLSPNQNWVTDVTNFNVSEQALYLSAMMDLYNGEIVAFETARRPLFGIVESMLRKAFTRVRSEDEMIQNSERMARLPWEGYSLPAYATHRLSD